MPALKDVVRKAHGMAPTLAQGPDEVLPDYYAPRHLEWLRRMDRSYSPEAIEHARKVFAGEYAHERSGRLSPSSLGTDCEREILFSFGGAPKLPSTPTAEDLMDSGSFEHLRWQMEGLSAGFLVDVEGWVHSEELRCGGSMDGIGDDGSLFELKNTAPHLFSAIVTGRGTAKNYARWMVAKHKMQMEFYWLIDSLQPNPRLAPVGSLVYQDRASKDVFEIRIRQNASRQKEAHRILESLHDWLDINELPDMLDGCWKAVTPSESPTEKEMTKYRRCAYREHCPLATTVMAE